MPRPDQGVCSPEAGVTSAERAHLACHLRAEFAGGAEHQRLHRPVCEVQTLQNRQRKRRRLAAACLRLADQIPAGQQRRNACRLNRRRNCVRSTSRVTLAVPVLKADGRGVGYFGHAIVSSRSSALLGQQFAIAAIATHWNAGGGG